MSELERKVGVFKFSVTTPRFSNEEGARFAAEALAGIQEIQHLPQVQASILEHEFEGHAKNDEAVMHGEEEGWFVLDVYGFRLSKTSFYGLRWVPNYNTTGTRTPEEFARIALAPHKPSADDASQTVARELGLMGILFGKRKR